jgi:orotidine-5'-phosphate decarboxylase
MTRQELFELIRSKRSFLCVGLDPDPGRMPAFFKGSSNDPLFEFNRRIIDATIDSAVAFKPNLAFFESHGSRGWVSLEKTIDYLKNHPGGPVFIIADAKRGDIGNSATHYARAFFEALDVDAVTLSPYMGHDSIQPFLLYKGKWAVILALTSNPGAMDFQALQPQLPQLLEKFGIKTSYWKKLFEMVMEEAMKWGTADNTMFVVGATQTELLSFIRETVPDHFFLIPGVGAQGGSLAEVSRQAMNKHCGILVNLSRSILFASQGKDFDLAAGKAAEGVRREMEGLLRERKLIG